MPGLILPLLSSVQGREEPAVRPKDSWEGRRYDQDFLGLSHGRALETERPANSATHKLCALGQVT